VNVSALSTNDVICLEEEIESIPVCGFNKKCTILGSITWMFLTTHCNQNYPI